MTQIYNDDLPDELYSVQKDFHLDRMYELCVNELQSQQTKRDQIIAFYIAIISFAVPAIVNMNLDAHIKGAAFLLLYALGSMLSIVVVRYRIYKEVYWITCRTISQLYILKQNEITKEIIQSVFYKTMRKNAHTVRYMDENTKKVSLRKSYKKVSKSAETVLYKILVLMSTVIFGIGVYLLLGTDLRGLAAAAVISVVIAVISNIFWNIYYCKQLTGVYSATTDGQDESFNRAFSKAWFLHFY